MQTDKAKNTRKKKQALVYKPYLKGKGYGQRAMRKGLKIAGFQLVFAFLYLFMGQALMTGNLPVRILINLGILAVFASLLYYDGMKSGQDDVAFGEIALSRKDQGHELSAADLARCYAPGQGIMIVLCGILPFFIACLVFAVLAEPQSYVLGSLPSWLQAYNGRTELNLALSYYNDRAGIQTIDALRMLVRLLLFPYINMVGVDQTLALFWVERLSPILILLVPMSYAIGYTQGPRLRAMIHGGIASNQRKALKRAQKKRKPQNQEPKQLI